MSKRSQSTAYLIAIAVMFVVVVLLLTSPGLLFSPLVTFIDTELYRSSGNEISVRTKTDFGSHEHMAAFPLKIGKWEGYDYETTEYVESLGADLMVLRGYEPSTFTQPVFFLILQAKTESSFHPPKVCIRAQGHEIQEDGEEIVVVKDAAWAKESAPLSIPLKKLVTAKSSEDGKILERRVLLFCYVKGNRFYDDTITMIQVEALAPLTGSYEGSLNEEKEFITQAIPLMFEPASNTRSTPLLMTLIDQGITGYLIIALLFIVPFAIILFARLWWGKGGNKTTN